MMPLPLTCWGAMWNVVVGFVKWPVSRLRIATEMVKSWFAAIVWPFLGKTNLEEGMLDEAAMTPIGAGLHEPVVICLPFVIGRLATVAQKLMKLFVDVADATWPAVGWSWPSFSKPVAMTLGSSVSDDWGSPLLLLPPAAAADVLDAAAADEVVDVLPALPGDRCQH